MKIVFTILILFSFLNSANNKGCHCVNKVTILFENSYEKIFEFKDKIYKIVKGSDRRDSTLMILDENLRRYIIIEREEESP